MPSTGDIVRASDFEAIKPQLSIGSVSTGAAGGTASSSGATGTTPMMSGSWSIPNYGHGGIGSGWGSTQVTNPGKPGILIVIWAR